MRRRLVKSNKKGFTLIELLAVILILGIIALIAIPVVNGVIEEARKGAYENSVKNVVDSVDKLIITSQLNNDILFDGIYMIDELSSKLDVKNADNLNGYVEISNNEVINYSFSNGTYVVRKDGDYSDTINISKLTKSRMTSNFPYKTNYQNKIVNAYFLYGSVPSSYIEKWNVSSDGKVVAYVTQNKDDVELVDLYVVSENQIQAPLNMSQMFYRYNGLKKIFFDNFDSSTTTSMNSAFREATNLEYINAKKLDTSSVKTMDTIFYYCSSLKNLNVSTWNTSNLEAAYGMFGYCKSLIELDVSNIDISGLKNLNWMFYNASSLSKITGIEKWDTKGVETFRGFFEGYRGEINVSNFDTSSATNFHNMFAGTAITELDISHFDTRQVTDMGGMFMGCDRLTTIYVGSNWDISNVTTSSYMFTQAVNLEGAQKFNGKTDISMATTDGYLTLKQ